LYATSSTHLPLHSHRHTTPKPALSHSLLAVDKGEALERTKAMMDIEAFLRLQRGEGVWVYEGRQERNTADRRAGVNAILKCKSSRFHLLLPKRTTYAREESFKQL
jgi:hypothetical protein